jgi:hypothetical protein
MKWSWWTMGGRPRKVTSGRRNGSDAEVIEGLRDAERVAVCSLECS